MPLKKICFLLLFSCLLLTACNPVIQEEKRPSGQVIAAAPEEIISTAFFAYSVDNALSSRMLQNYLPQEKEAVFLCLDLTIRNENKETVPMDYSDFLIVWQEGNETGSAYPLQLFCDTQLPDRYSLLASEQRSGQLIYQVPKGINCFLLRYQEIYTDDYIGNTYEVSITLPDK